MALVQSPVQFSSVGNEASYFITHIARPFMGGFSGSGENGIDVALPLDTPIYAVQSGTVVGSGYYAGGGVVSVNSGPGRIWYYQHLDQNAANVGQYVQAGQLIGYSGGQNSGGNHPASTTYSSFQHIEIGLNAPWGGAWGNPSGKGNVNPVPALSTIAGVKTPTTNAGASSGGSSSSGGGATFSALDPSTWVPGIFSGILSLFGLSSPVDLLWRVGLIISGLILIFIGFQVMFARQEAELAGSFTGAAAKAA